MKSTSPHFVTWRCSVPRSSSCLAFFDTASTSLGRFNHCSPITKESLSVQYLSVHLHVKRNLFLLIFVHLPLLTLITGFLFPPRYFIGASFFQPPPLRGVMAMWAMYFWTSRQRTYPAPAFSVEDAAGTLSASTSFGTEKYSTVENGLQKQRRKIHKQSNPLLCYAHQGDWYKKLPGREKVMQRCLTSSFTWTG